jgi:3-hydroxyacyl-[acyl-carrier-protein] dehydratase
VRFVFLDEIVQLDPGRSIRAVRVWLPDLDVFADHFPGMPVVPGVLLTEMMGQAAATCVEAAEPAPGKAMLAQIRNAVFRRWVRPAERVDIEAEVKALRPSFASVSCRAKVEGAVAAESELLFSFVPWHTIGESYRNPALERYRSERGT